jgi:beta-galactosidase
MKPIFSYLFFFLFNTSINAQIKSYEIDASHVVKKDIMAIDMEATNPQGIKLSVNNECFEKNNKPWFPLMGEMHYNRVPYQSWEEEILKMKSAGLAIIATYIFWNEQEPQKGVWDWKDNRDLRHFVELCKKHGMYVWLRIGPWSHGEQLNGGFPDWIEQMKGKRTNDPAYLSEVAKLFEQISKQTNNLYFKSAGPIIGVQLENEYASGQQGHIYILI